MSIELWRTNTPSSRLVVTAHGRNGAARAPHMQKLIDAYRARDYAVVSPDCCASAWNDSAGNEADFLLEHHVRDVHRTIDWAITNAAALGWNGAHLALCGHSMGAYAVARLAADDYAGRVAHLLLVSPFTPPAFVRSRRAKNTIRTASLTSSVRCRARSTNGRATTSSR